MELISGLNSYIELQLSQNLGYSSFLFLLIGGFLASLLPCVYPIYPITAEVLRNHSESKKSIFHPTIYIIGFTITYGFFGIIAVLTGGTFNQILRWAETNFFIGVFLFLLGLSSIDLLSLPFFKTRDLSKSNQSYLNTFFFGVGTALLSSPCVGPIVITILLKIATLNQEITLESYFLAGSKMLFFGFGLSIPFFLIGVFGVKLPKSGKWMKKVQFLLSALIFYFSYTFLLKAIQIANLDQKDFHKLLLLSLLFLLFAYKIQKKEILNFEKMKISILYLGLLWTATLIFLYANKVIKPSQNSHQPFVENFPIPDLPFEPDLEGKQLLVEQKENLTWYRDKELAFKIAKRDNKKIFIDFYADWCTNCKEFEKLTISDKDLNQALSKVILYKVYDTDKEFDHFSDEERFAELRIGLPFFVILAPDQSLIYKTTDYLKTKEMIKAMK